MPLLLRRLTKAWSLCNSAPDWQIQQCPPKLVKELSEGMSVWVLTNDIDKERLLAALAMSEKQPTDIQYLEIDQSFVQGLEIEVSGKQPGTTCDASVNKLHRELIKITPDKLSKLACHMKGLAPITLECNEMLKIASLNFQAGNFDVKVFTKNQRDIQGTIIERFLTGGLLKFC